MLTTIDAAGRLVVPKALRDQLGLSARTTLDLRAVDGRLEAVVPSTVGVEEGVHGARFVTETGGTLSADQVRDLMEQGRR